VIFAVGGLATAGSASPGAGTAQDLPPDCRIEQAAAGVWRIRCGQPEKFTPKTFQSDAPRLDALAALTPCAEMPVALARMQFKTSSRGCALEMPLEPNEHLYGLGMNLRVFELNDSKKTVRVSDDQGTTLGDSHAPAPFYVSTRGYGIYVDTARYASFYFGTLESAGNAARPSAAKFVGIDIPGARGVDVYVMGGPDLRHAVQRYNLFAGGGCLPPMWGLGVWYRASAKLDQQQVGGFLKEFRRRHIPCDVFGLEPGWQTHAYSCSFVWSRQFPDPAGLLRQTAGDGYRLNLWEHCFTHPSSPLYGPLKRWSGDYTVWDGLVPDFASPQGRALFADYHGKNLVDKGICGFKLDECDHQPLGNAPWSYPEHSSFPSGLDGEQMHLLIGSLYQRAIAALYRERNQRTLGLVRASGALATPLPFALYSDAYDHRDYVRAIATSGFGGILWCPEIRDAPSLEELYRRVETNAFSAVMQFNCWYLKNPVWKQINTDKNNADKFMDRWEQAESVCRNLLQWRMRLLPYLYAAYAEYRASGIPPTRALVMDYPHDPAVEKIDDQYLFGPSLMVAPLFTGQQTRSVYLPKGDWYDFWTGEKHTGGAKIHVSKSVEQIPVFVKGGSLLPLAEPVEHVTAAAQFRVTVRVYGPQPASTTLYEDDFTTFAFEQGRQNRIKLSWHDGKGTVEKAGNYAGPSRYAITAWQPAGN
jgi:alpha-D-xyloside xylohydrolase